MAPHHSRCTPYNVTENDNQPAAAPPPPRKARVTQFGFRARLFLILSLFALLPALVLTIAWGATFSSILPLVTEGAAWDSVAASGQRVLVEMRKTPLTEQQQRALRDHEQELNISLTQARRFRYLAMRAPPVVLLLAAIGLGLVALIASRVAGHLSRQLSRPLHELVGWTDLIARGEALPGGAARRGAPEFEVLREQMRAMAAELERGRERELEAERLRAFRESARRVAHELKNPLTPIRFAVDRLRREAPPTLGETVEVLATEANRLETMARSFAQFGRLPEGATSAVDVEELVRSTARSTIPEGVAVEVSVDPAVPMVRGQYDALARALTNVLINAVEACQQNGRIGVVVDRTILADGRPAVRIAVKDSGCGIPADRLARIWEPYVTDKPGGTGLGLAIARQTIVAHHGAVDAASTVGKGTEIRFILPISDDGMSRETS